MASIGDLAIKLTANADGLSETLEQSQKLLTRFRERAVSAGDAALVATADAAQKKLSSLPGAGNLGDIAGKKARDAAEGPLKKSQSTAKSFASMLQEAIQGFSQLGQEIQDGTAGPLDLANIAIEKLKGGFASVFGVESIGRVVAMGAAILGIGSALATVTSAVQKSADREQTIIAFETMLHNGEKAKKLASDLQAMAVVTPFGSKELAAASRVLMAFGVESKDLLGTLKMLGDISATSQKPIEQIAVIFGQVRAAGRLMAGDALQLTSAGIPIWEEVGKVMGKNAEQVRKLSEAGQVGFGQFLQAMLNLTQQGGIAFGAMEKQSKGLTGLFSTLMDSIDVALGDFGDELVKALSLKELQDRLTLFINGLKQDLIPALATAVRWLVEWGGVILKTATAITIALSAMTAMIALYVLWTMKVKILTAAKAMLLAVSGPGGWAVLAAGIAIGVASYKALGLAADFAEEHIRATMLAGKEAGMVAARNLKISTPDPKAEQAMALAKRVKAMKEDLQKEIDTFGLTKEQIALRDLARQGATAQQIAEVNALQKTNEWMDRVAQKMHFAGSMFDVVAQKTSLFKQALDQGRISGEAFKNFVASMNKELEETIRNRSLDIFNSTRTPLEEFKTHMAELSELLRRGAIDWIVFGRAASAALDKLAQANKVHFQTPGAIHAGSQESFASRAAQLADLRGSKSNDPAKILADAVKNDEKFRKVLLDKMDKIRQALKDRGINVPDF